MAGVATQESGAGSSFEGVSSGKVQLRCQSEEALMECRSSEQVENGVPSTSPPYWDSDDEDGGPKPAELYGKYTWKIDKFSQINKRELRSNAFEVGGYKWYILIYPQGCDVCNHLSLFLCVANHDKLLPGWSHFAQFTIAVVNKDPTKSKYSDTLHRFWKKEHDWGWKKFMELSKVSEGFIDADTLIIKAQVQVIRERADRPFRCLDCQYRRELVRVYLTNVEQICRRFVEERRGKLGKLIEDKARWSSGLKALEGQYTGKKSKGKYLEAAEKIPTPIIRIEKDTFILGDDVLLLLERAALEPLPPKDEKGPQNRTKDGATGEEFSKDSSERDERRLTELGRRTIEIFVLAQIFSKIEVAYQEAVSLKKQEELIREEEAAWLAEIELKARRGADKEKKSKKKQAKQKKNNRKGKDKGRDEKPSSITQDKIEHDSPTVEKEDLLVTESKMELEKSEVVEDVSDASDSVDYVSEIKPLDSEDRDLSPVNWDTDTCEVHPPTEASSSGISALSGSQNGPSAVDDSSSTCSSDSVPSVLTSVPQRGNFNHNKNKKSLSRGRNHQSKVISYSADWDNEEPKRLSEAVPVARPSIDAPRSSKAVETLSKEEETSPTSRNISAKDVAVEVSKAASLMSPPRSPSKSIPSIAPPKLVPKVNAVNDPLPVKKSFSENPIHADRSVSLASSAGNTVSKPDNVKSATPKPTQKPSGHLGNEKQTTQDMPVTTTDKPPMPVMSRPLSAPLIPGPSRPAVSMVSMVQAAPTLARSVSAAGRLGPEPPVASVAQSYVPQSYRNAIIGSHVTGNSSAYTQNHSSSSYSQAPAPYSPHSSDRMDPNPHEPGFSFGPLWADYPRRDNSSRNLHVNHATLLNDMQGFDLYNPVHSRSQPSDFQAGISGRQNHALADEFPHLDIINDLLDDEHVIGGNMSRSNSGYQNFSSHLNRQLSFPCDPGMSSGPGLGTSTSSCRFERTRSYNDDVFQHSYGSPYDTMRDFIPQGQASTRPYLNGPVDGLMPNQWQMGGLDLPYMSVMNASDNDGYHHHLHHHVPEYPNLSVGVNGYTVFRPSNGL
ncbi:hypothetical protein RD792_009604 [Penstemon davidsonii]|uniref:MATH domain-containing protein n=1 Tax=Penstemon davidsonii TaxID=160366 RepID=A0ABR0CZQ9_9LAMI|nr:hypothetical protein RD792_009604 [Penstemon davidsonii]